MLCLLYLNPAAGSLAYQIIVGFVLVITTFWRRPWRWLSSMLHKNKRA